MNILFITHHYLHGNGGGCFASRAYVNSLAEFASVTLVCPTKKGLEPEDIDSRVTIKAVYNNRNKILKFLDLCRGKIDRYIGKLEDELVINKYEIVVFDTSFPSFRQIDIAHKYGCKVITIHHNYQVEYTRDNEKGLIGKILLFWIEKCERESVSKSDLNLTLTEDDKRLLHKHYDSNRKASIKVLGTYEYKRREPICINNRIPCINNRFRFVITGSLASIQTYESLYLWFNKYLPILKEMCPAHTLTLAGRSPSEHLKKLCNSLGVKIIPSPQSMETVLLDADYYICPIELGGGLKLRIMDGLKAGLPVLTHDVSLRGYEIFHDKFVYAYHDQISFAQSLSKMLLNQVSSLDIQKEYLKIFSFDSGVNRIKKFIYSLC